VNKFTIHRADPEDIWLKKPGVWRPAKIENDKRTATVSCPKCGKSASLSDHEIAADGAVTPSLVCPHEPCTFHEFVKLEGWVPTP
jgi:hypothetical protein